MNMLNYHQLINEILVDGYEENNERTGTGTKALFGRMLKFDLRRGFPILHEKRVPFKTMLKELVWFLRGSTNATWLQERDCHIWDEWALPEDEFTELKLDGPSRLDYYCSLLRGQGLVSSASEVYHKVSHSTIVDGTKYLDSVGAPTHKKLKAASKGDLGPVYGWQWRNWCGRSQPIDQIEQAIDKLKTNPADRGIVVSAWNVDDLPDMKLRPCHMIFQFNSEPSNQLVNGKRVLSCHMTQRSCDAFLGLPFNIASYAVLTHLIAHVTNHTVGELTISLGNVHLYNNHIKQAKLMLTRVKERYAGKKFSSVRNYVFTPGKALPRISFNKKPAWLTISPEITEKTIINNESDVLLDGIKLSGYYPMEAISAPISV